MARHTNREGLAAIEDVLRRRPEGAAATEIQGLLTVGIPLRTLQYRLKHLVAQNRLVMRRSGRSVSYRLAEDVNASASSAVPGDDDEPVIPLSRAGLSIRNYVRLAPEARRPVGYNRGFLDQYRPNVSFYLTERERAQLASTGQVWMAAQPAGTYARHILNRLLIDLAWNSSRLEGNTYSLLDTRRLIEFGKEADGRAHVEAQMILNHKDAIEFLVNSAEDTAFNAYTLFNLHALLANNLLADPSAAGRLRYIAVGIERSVFLPLEVPQLIEECCSQLLATADAIEDPFEQAFFVMVQLPYLQPFDDVNKRVSRLAANIPLIRNNLSPLSFADVPRRAYTEAILGVYELNKIDLLKDLFIWAYQRSAARHAAVRQSLGEPDPFRLRYRTELRDVVAGTVRSAIDRKGAVAWISAWAAEHVPEEDRAQFTETAETELTSLHEGNFARFQIRPSEFAAWDEIWRVR